MHRDFVISSGEQRKRLDLFLVHREAVRSRAAVQRMITSGWIRLNDRPTKPGRIIKAGDVITVDAPEAAPLCLHGETRPLEVIFEDDQCLVVSKPAGIVVHPGQGHWSDTLLNAVLDHWVRTGQTAGAGLVHRLDKETSGVMVIAKTDHAHKRLGLQFERHTITRRYEALVWGLPVASSGRIDVPIGQDREQSHRTSPATLRPKAAVTAYQVTAIMAGRAARLLVQPETGRTHQIRAHLKTIGHPIVGDRLYGNEGVVTPAWAPRVMLHATTLGFRHPVSDDYHEYTVAPPADFLNAQRALAGEPEAMEGAG